MKLLKKIKKGFTLVELVVVIAIIAILSGVSVAVYARITNNAKETAAQSEADSIGTVVRAAVLMNADGATVDLVSGHVGTANHTSSSLDSLSVDAEKTATVRAYWDTNTIKVEITKVGNSTTGLTNYVVDEAEVVKAIYKQVENTDLTGTLDSDGTYDNTINWFTYSPSKDSHKGTYKFSTVTA